MLEDKLEQDIKSAMLAGDTERITTLRGLKASLLNLKVATGKRQSGLTDEEVMQTLSKEAKKRQESADLYLQGQSKERADKELREKAIIEAYLPKQLDEAEVTHLIDDVIKQIGAKDISSMGQVIGAVKAKAGASADGGVIARLTKERLQ